METKSKLSISPSTNGSSISALGRLLIDSTREFKPISIAQFTLESLITAKLKSKSLRKCWFSTPIRDNRDNAFYSSSMLRRQKMMSNPGQSFLPGFVASIGHFPLDDLSLWTTRRRDDKQIGQYETLGCPVPLLQGCLATNSRGFLEGDNFRAIDFWNNIPVPLGIGTCHHLPIMSED
jgi:hypothetical protein